MMDQIVRAKITPSNATDWSPFIAQLDYVPLGLEETNLTAQTFEKLQILDPRKTADARSYLKGIAAKFLRREDMLFSDVEIYIVGDENLKMMIDTELEPPVIYVGKEYLRYEAESEDEIAYVIAHELAHKHINLINKQKTRGRIAENTADQLAIIWLIEAGYNWKAGRDFYIRYAGRKRHDRDFGQEIFEFVKAEHSEDQNRAKYMNTFVGGWIHTKGFQNPPEPRFTRIDEAARDIYDVYFSTYMDYVKKETKYYEGSLSERLDILLSIPPASIILTNHRTVAFLQALARLEYDFQGPAFNKKFADWYQRLPSKLKRGNNSFGTLAYAAASGVLEDYLHSKAPKYMGIPDPVDRLLPSHLGYSELDRLIQNFMDATSYADAVQTAKEMNLAVARLRRDHAIKELFISLPSFTQWDGAHEKPWAKYYDWVQQDKSGMIVTALWHMGASGDENLWPKIEPTLYYKLKHRQVISAPQIDGYAPANSVHAYTGGVKSICRSPSTSGISIEHIWYEYRNKADIRWERFEGFVNGEISLNDDLNIATLRNFPSSYMKILDEKVREIIDGIDEGRAHSRRKARTSLRQFRKKVVADLQEIAADPASRFSEALSALVNSIYKGSEHLDGFIFSSVTATPHNEAMENAEIRSNPLLQLLIPHIKLLNKRDKRIVLDNLRIKSFLVNDISAIAIENIREWLEYKPPQNAQDLLAIYDGLAKTYDPCDVQKYMAIELTDWVIRNNLTIDHPDIAVLGSAIEVSSNGEDMYGAINYLAQKARSWHPEHSEFENMDTTSAIHLLMFYDSFDFFGHRGLRNAFISKIKNDIRSEQDPSKKRQLCEKILWQGAWHLRSPQKNAMETFREESSRSLSNPDLIKFMTQAWADSIQTIYGLDDGSFAYLRQLEKIIKNTSNECSAEITCQLIRCLSDAVVTQKKASYLCATYIKKRATGSKLAVAGLNTSIILSEGLLKYFSAKDSRRLALIDYLSKPMDRGLRGRLVSDMTRDYKSAKREMRRTKDTSDEECYYYNQLIDGLPGSLQKTRLNNTLENIHRVYWDQPLPIRAIVMDQLILPAHKVVGRQAGLPYDHPRSPYRNAAEFVLDKLFPLPDTANNGSQPERNYANFIRTSDEVTNGISGEEQGAYATSLLTEQEIKKRVFIRTFLHRYIANSHETERGLLLAAFMTGALHGESCNEARRFALILESLGPAYIKLGQAIDQHPQTPQEYRDAVCHMSKKTNAPTRWDHFQRIDDVLPESIANKITWTGPITGAASFKIVSDIRLSNNEQYTLGYLRSNARAQAVFGYEKMIKTARDVISEMPEFVDVGTAIIEMIEQTKELTAHETDLHIGAQQTISAQKVFEPLIISTDGYQFCFRFMSWKYYVDQAMLMQTGQGMHWDELPVSTDNQKRFHHAIAKAFLTLILTPILAGQESDMDRHYGQALMGTGTAEDKNHTIDLFDAGGMTIEPPSEQEIRQLGQCLAVVIRKGKFDLNTLSDEFLKTISDIQRTSGVRPSYLLHVQRALLASGNFARSLSQEDFIDVLVGIFKAGVVHPILANELRGAIMGAAMNTGNMMRFLSVSPSDVTVNRTAIEPPVKPVYWDARQKIRLFRPTERKAGNGTGRQLKSMPSAEKNLG